MFRAFLQKTLLSQKTVLEAALRKSQSDAAKTETTLQDKVVVNRQLSGEVCIVGSNDRGDSHVCLRCDSGYMILLKVIISKKVKKKNCVEVYVCVYISARTHACIYAERIHVRMHVCLCM